MATGDLANNIRKMCTRLKAIKYSDEIDVIGIKDGSPTPYLPIYHYAFTSYSPALAELILGKDIELYGKSDSRFMEAIYKVLRDVFAYKPPVTKSQFFSKSFVERKVIMCSEIIDLVKKKHLELKPPPPKTTMKTSVRPKSADSGLLKAAKCSGSDGSKISPRGSDLRPETTGRAPLQIVNELLSEPMSEPVRHYSHSASSHISPTRHIATHHGLESDRGHAVVRETNRPMFSESPPQVNRYTPESSPVSDHSQPVHMFNTPSIRRVCPQSVEVVSVPRRDDTGDGSILEIQAATSDSVLHGPVASQQAEVLTKVTDLYKTTQKLMDLVFDLNRQIETVKSEQSKSQQMMSTDRGVTRSIDKVQAQISTLMARMTLMENRVTMIEAKVDGLHGITPNATSQPYSVPVPLSKSTDTNLDSRSYQSINGFESSSSTTVIGRTIDRLGDRVENVSKEGYANAGNQKSIKDNSSGSRQQEKEGQMGRQAISQLPTKDTGTSLPANGRPKASQPETILQESSQAETSLPESSPALFAGPGTSFTEELRAMSTNARAFSPLKDAADFSLNYSPIRKVVNGVAGQMMSANEDTFALETEDDARRSSTPTKLGESSLHCHYADEDTKNVATKINNMLKETMQMMKGPKSSTPEANMH